MAEVFCCFAYDDVMTNMRVADGVVYVGMKFSKNNSELHLTLNPVQAKVLGHALLGVEDLMLVGAVEKEFLFGSMEVSYDVQNDGYEKQDAEPYEFEIRPVA